MKRVLGVLLFLAGCARAGSVPAPGSPAPAAGAPGGTGAAGSAAVASAPEPPPIRAGVAPPPGPYAEGFRAFHYDLRIALADTGSSILGRTRVLLTMTAPRMDTLPLDLTGLAVDTVRVNDAPAGYSYDAGKLRIAVPVTARPDDTLRVDVAYHGHPDDGLIIGRNVHGDRTAFADDWPNRARFWFPSIDHPSDKATADILVRVPKGWRVVANGAAAPPVALPAGWDADTTRWTVAHWATRVPIPTYTMVFGAARFVEGTSPGPPPPAGASSSGPVAVSWWLFPEDTASARSFRNANRVVAYFSALIAPFPYAKLAHVESSTKFGGMENASAIFYDEKALAARMDIEQTVAHETAHQWFGDSVTESDWHHLWLAEGFADYLAALWEEHAQGEEKFRSIMAESRAGYLASDVTGRPIIDPQERDLFALLNRNNYDKGAWVLHMLRGLLGDSAFFGGLRRYYAAHAGGNALTDDLRRALEETSGRDLQWFFQQWLFEPGYPRVALSWSWEPTRRTLAVTVRQVQDAAWPTFRFPLTLELATPAGRQRRTIEVTRREQTFDLELPAAPTSLRPDPDTRLLAAFERSSP